MELALDFALRGAPRLTLRNLRVAKTLSQETVAFTAIVAFDGKTFDARNDGGGGCNRYTGDWSAIDAATAYAKTLTDSVEPLDEIVGAQIETTDLLRALRRSTSRNLCFILPGGDVRRGYQRVTGPADASARAWLAAHHPDAIVLNDLLPAAPAATRRGRETAGAN